MHDDAASILVIALFIQSCRLLPFGFASAAKAGIARHLRRHLRSEGPHAVVAVGAGDEGVAAQGIVPRVGEARRGQANAARFRLAQVEVVGQEGCKYTGKEKKTETETETKGKKKED